MAFACKVFSITIMSLRIKSYQASPYQHRIGKLVKISPDFSVISLISLTVVVQPIRIRSHPYKAMVSQAPLLERLCKIILWIYHMIKMTPQKSATKGCPVCPLPNLLVATSLALQVLCSRLKSHNYLVGHLRVQPHAIQSKSWTLNLRLDRWSWPY